MARAQLEASLRCLQLLVEADARVVSGDTALNRPNRFGDLTEDRGRLPLSERAVLAPLLLALHHLLQVHASRGQGQTLVP